MKKKYHYLKCLSRRIFSQLHGHSWTGEMDALPSGFEVASSELGGLGEEERGD